MHICLYCQRNNFLVLILVVGKSVIFKIRDQMYSIFSYKKGVQKVNENP